MEEDDNDCIFCQIGAGTTPADVVHESDNTLFFRDLNPQAPVHVLGISRKHIQSVSTIAHEDDAIIGQLVREAGEVAQKVGIAESGFRLIANTGRDADQSVDHLHFHLIGGEDLGALLG